jgi:hypothetical protein
VPSVRFTRDKRGYEHVYLVDATGRKGKPSKPRVLYWFRTPPGVKVGREPFDEEVRRELEKRYPNLSFDWDAIVSTPMPPPEIDWRERRRVQRAAKEASTALEREELAEEKASDETALGELSPSAEEMALDAAESIGTLIEAQSIDPDDSIDPEEVIDALVDSELDAADVAPAAGEAVTPEKSQLAESPRPRRRGGRRRRRRTRQTGASAAVEGGGKSGSDSGPAAETSRPIDPSSKTR